MENKKELKQRPCITISNVAFAKLQEKKAELQKKGVPVTISFLASSAIMEHV